MKEIDLEKMLNVLLDIESEINTFAYISSMLEITYRDLKELEAEKVSCLSKCQMRGIKGELRAYKRLLKQSRSRHLLRW